MNKPFILLKKETAMESYKTIILFGELELNIPLTDWTYLCEHLFLSDNPPEDVVRAEFVFGTGINRNIKHLWSEAAKRFTEHIEDLREIQSLNISEMADTVLSDEEKYVVL